jgi:TRAP-type C4-dicarboxylate transport system substrate-binding protein
MKRSIFVFVLVAALLLSACGGSKAPTGATPENPVTFQIGHSTAEVETDPYYVTATKLKALVEERTKGAVKIDVKGGSQLGAEREMIEGIQTEPWI